MVGWKTWICFKQSFLLPTKCFLLKLTSHSRHKSKGNGHGLVSLYKDMESCGEYEDIRVMWEIIHSCQQNANNTTRRRKRSSSYWRFCLQPHKLCPSFSKDLAFG
ncbi:hypothetical protein D8674_007963 [Pyrus ussuriensis x Pyrus communis]|uniref:Uncharacterized protein n=1 Tax=Pyrus ussuriensis x Pyrus communis TaxID=2448454 RepID=A0A5N5I4B1_9ROSA|nr:hypothetical protein D8674_007963 [Pyrus ussuriensis x Pyrus communis]